MRGVGARPCFIFVWDLEILDTRGSNFHDREGVCIDQLCIRCDSAELSLRQLATETEWFFKVIVFVLAHTPNSHRPVLVSHNAKHDTRLLLAALEDPPTWLFACSIDLLKRVLPNQTSYKLETLCQRYNIDYKAHEAQNDVDALCQLLDNVGADVKDARTLEDWATCGDGETLLIPQHLNQVYTWLESSEVYHSRACQFIISVTDASAVRVSTKPPSGRRHCKCCKRIIIHSTTTTTTTTTTTPSSTSPTPSPTTTTTPSTRACQEEEEESPRVWWVTSQHSNVFHAYAGCSAMRNARSPLSLLDVPPTDKKRLCKICKGIAVGRNDYPVLQLST